MALHSNYSLISCAVFLLILVPLCMSDVGNEDRVAEVRQQEQRELERLKAHDNPRPTSDARRTIIARTDPQSTTR